MFCGARLDEFDQDFAAAGERHEEKIHTRAIGTGARDGIDGIDAPMAPKYFGGAIDITDLKFHLLNSFSRSLQIARDRPICGWIATRKDVQLRSIGKIHLELNGILLGRHVS